MSLVCTKKIGWHLVTKLKREHVYLNSYSGMRVDLVIQINIQNEVHHSLYMSLLYNATCIYFRFWVQRLHMLLKTLGMKVHLRHYASFEILIIFSDCLNGRSTTESVLKRKPDPRPYRDPNDPRLSVRTPHIVTSCNYPWLFFSSG